MKNIILLFCLSTSLHTYASLITCVEKDTIQIITTKFYKGYGVIFPKEYHPPFEGFDHRFTPTRKEIEKTEEILLSQYNLAKKNDSRELRYKYVKNVKKKFINYYRQYTGFYNSSGEKIIFIRLMNFRYPKKANKYFGHWRDKVSIGFEGFYGTNQEIYEVNLNKSELIIP